MSQDSSLMYAGPVTSVKITSALTDIGGTFDGVTISKEDEWMDIVCDQVLGTFRKELTSRKFIVDLNMAELSLANMEKALAQKSGNLVSSSLKLDDEAQGTVALEIAVPCPTGVGTRTFHFDLAYVMGNSALSYKKGTQTVIPMRLECIQSTSSGQFGYIKDA